MKSEFEKIGLELGTLVTSKNKKYGDSFVQSEEFLKLLWPNGVPVESYTDLLCIIRIFDKLKRIATDKTWNGESPYMDIGGYAILGFKKDLKKNPSTKKPTKRAKKP